MKKIITTLLLTITCIASLLVFTPKSNALLIGNSYDTGWQECNFVNDLGVTLNDSNYNNYVVNGDTCFTTTWPYNILEQSNLDHYFLYSRLALSSFKSSSDYLYLVLGGMKDLLDDIGETMVNYSEALSVVNVFAYYTDNGTFDYNQALNSSVYLSDFTTDFLWKDSSNHYNFANNFIINFNFNYNVNYRFVTYGFYLDFSNFDWEFDSTFVTIGSFVDSFTSDIDFANGFNEGNKQGYNNGYTIGYNEGNSNGLITGYNNGYNQGLIEGRSENDGWFANGLMSIFTIPFGVFSSIWNFDIMGINISSIILALLSLGLVAWIVKKIFLSR